MDASLILSLLFLLQLMDATLCDTVGTQIITNKRTKSGSSVSPQPLAKITAKLQGPQPTTAAIRPNGDPGTTGDVESMCQVAISSQIINSPAAINSMSTATISPTNAPDLKPLIVLNSDIVTASIHPANIVPPPSFISSPCLTETASPSLSLGSTSYTDLNTSRYVSRKAPSLSSGVIPFRLSNNQNLLGHPSSVPSTSSYLTPSNSTSLCATAMSGTEGQNHRGDEEQSSSTLFQEILKRQDGQAHLDRVSRRRVEAREKRCERREMRMAESLGRIATAMELLTSKQDTVIALLQRLADRK